MRCRFTQEEDLYFLVCLIFGCAKVAVHLAFFVECLSREVIAQSAIWIHELFSLVVGWMQAQDSHVTIHSVPNLLGWVLMWGC